MLIKFDCKTPQISTRLGFSHLCHPESDKPDSKSTLLLTLELLHISMQTFGVVESLNADISIEQARPADEDCLIRGKAPEQATFYFLRQPAVRISCFTLWESEDICAKI